MAWRSSPRSTSIGWGIGTVIADPPRGAIVIVESLQLLSSRDQRAAIQWMSCDPPLGHTFFQARPLSSAGGDQCERLVGIDAQRAATIGDDQRVGWQFGEPFRQFVQRNRARTREMVSRKFD